MQSESHQPGAAPEIDGTQGTGRHAPRAAQFGRQHRRHGVAQVGTQFGIEPVGKRIEQIAHVLGWRGLGRATLGRAQEMAHFRIVRQSRQCGTVVGGSLLPETFGKRNEPEGLGNLSGLRVPRLRRDERRARCLHTARQAQRIRLVKRDREGVRIQATRGGEGRQGIIPAAGGGAGDAEFEMGHSHVRFDLRGALQGDQSGRGLTPGAHVTAQVDPCGGGIRCQFRRERPLGDGFIGTAERLKHIAEQQVLVGVSGFQFEGSTDAPGGAFHVASVEGDQAQIEVGLGKLRCQRDGLFIAAACVVQTLVGEMHAARQVERIRRRRFVGRQLIEQLLHVLHGTACKGSTHSRQGDRSSLIRHVRSLLPVKLPG